MEWKLLWILECLVISISGLCEGRQPSIYKGLFDFVIGSSNPLVVPKKTLPISVGVQCGIVAIHSIDREKNQMDVTRWGSVTWHSDLTWDSTQFNGLKNVSVPYHSIWLPDLHLYNANSKFEFLRQPTAVMFDNGMQAMFSHIRSKINCGDDLRKNTCTFRMASWGANSLIMRINEQSENPFDMNKILVDEEFQASPFDVLSYKYTKQTLPVGNLTDTVDLMEFTFTFREKNPRQFLRPLTTAILQWG